MGRREIEIGYLKQGDYFWFDGLEWSVEHIGGKYVHVFNVTKGSQHLECCEKVEVSNLQ